MSQRMNSLIKKTTPMWLTIVLLTAILGVAVAFATTISTKTYTAVGGEKVIISADLTLTSAGTVPIPAGVGDAALTGAFIGTDVICRGNAIISTDFVFKVVLTEKTTTPVSTAYTVTLYGDGSIVGSALMVTSDVTPDAAAAGNVECYWNIGTDYTTGTVYFVVVE